MHIEHDKDTQTCTIWIDKEHGHDYKTNTEYQEAVKNSRASGYSICVYVGGELPLLPVIDEMLASNPITV